MAYKILTSKMKLAKFEDLVAKVLREYADQLIRRQSSGQTVSVEEARDLDRALRSCKGISDIDTVWVMWSYTGEPLGWLTTDELHYHWKKGFRYVEAQKEESPRPPKEYPPGSGALRGLDPDSGT